MARRNRVTPLGELVAAPARGLVFGNRGCLHDRDGRIRRHHAGRRWIACRLEYRGWRRAPLMAPGRYTELFFLDDATALAAGHRPCALCRRLDYDRLRALWRTLHPGPADAASIDATLHAERLDPVTGARRGHPVALDDVPDGAFVHWRGAPRLVLGDALVEWAPGGYGTRAARPSGARATLVTPPSLVALLRTGPSSLVPLLHPTAAAPG
jgi:hypothetical protein